MECSRVLPPLVVTDTLEIVFWDHMLRYNDALGAKILLLFGEVDGTDRSRVKWQHYEARDCMLCWHMCMLLCYQGSIWSCGRAWPKTRP